MIYYQIIDKCYKVGVIAIRKAGDGDGQAKKRG
jgi:hypothetical protein